MKSYKGINFSWKKVLVGEGGRVRGTGPGGRRVGCRSAPGGPGPGRGSSPF